MQGQYSEEDEETGFNHFEARNYDSKINRWLSGDPARQFYSPYVGMGNNPINSVDPDGGRPWDKFKLFSDGTMTREANDSPLDTYYYVQTNSEGVEFEQFIGFSIIESNDMIRFPSLGDGFTFYGNSDALPGGGSYGNGDNYADRDIAAALRGATFEWFRGGNPKVAFGDFSGSNGLSPNTAHTSHKDGLNVDFRYIRKDGWNKPVTVNSSQFDWTKNQNLINTFRKWGFGSILSYPNTSGTILQNTTEYTGHHNHGHLQGFSPNWRP